MSAAFSERAMQAESAAAYTPPYPFRSESTPPLWELIGTARKNFLAIWATSDFSNKTMNHKILTRQIFICNSPESVKEAFVTKHDIYQRKSPQMRHALEPLLGDGLFISDGEIWQQRRKIVAPIVHASRLPQFSPIMVDTARAMSSAWRELGDGAEIDALTQMAHLTAEIISRTIFGQQLGHDYADTIVKGFTDYQKAIDQMDITSLLGLPDWLPRFRRPSIKQKVKAIRDILDDIIDSHQSQQPTEESVLSRLLDAKDPDGKPLSRDAIANEAAVIFMAGHETTANTLAWAWYILSQAPWAAELLHDEITTALSGQPPTIKDVPRLPYTRAIIEETLRLYPPVPILAREALNDSTIMDRPVKKKALLMAVPWLLHRNPEYWDYADEFRPSRFLPESKARPSKHGYIPFAVGPRVCAGLAFGLTEAILCLAVLAREFRLELASDADIKPVCRLTLRPGNALPMIVRPSVLPG